MMAGVSRSDTFMTLPGTLPLDGSDYSDFEDFLTVPEHVSDFCLSSSSSLDATDLFLGDLGESTSSLSSPASDAGSRLQELTSDFPVALGDAVDRQQQQQQMPLAARLPLGTHGLKLRLDCGSVLSAWHSMAGGCHPFHMRGPLLAAATAAIPSASDLAASLAASAPPSPHSGLSLSSGDSAGDAAGEEARRREAAARLARDKKAGSRKTADRKVLYNPARKPSNDKRPRIKGRFVTKSEFQQVHVVAADRTVPGTLLLQA